MQNAGILFRLPEMLFYLDPAVWFDALWNLSNGIAYTISGSNKKRFLHRFLTLEIT
jgi:hypothetical protein